MKKTGTCGINPIPALIEALNTCRPDDGIVLQLGVFNQPDLNGRVVETIDEKAFPKMGVPLLSYSPSMGDLAAELDPKRAMTRMADGVSGFIHNYLGNLDSFRFEKQGDLQVVYGTLRPVIRGSAVDVKLRSRLEEAKDNLYIGYAAVSRSKHGRDDELHRLNVHTVRSFHIVQL